MAIEFNPVRTTPGVQPANQVNRASPTDAANTNVAPVETRSRKPVGVEVLIQFSNELLSQSNSLRSSTEGVSTLQVIENGIGNITSTLSELKQITDLVLSGNLDATALESLEKRSNELLELILLIILGATFNGASLLEDDTRIVIETGPDGGNFEVIPSFNISSELQSLGVFTLDIRDPNSVDIIRNSEEFLQTIALQLGERQDNLNDSIQRLIDFTFNGVNPALILSDSGSAAILTEQIHNQLWVQASLALAAQANANRDLVFHLLAP
ncbi:hypothetical protein [Marinobacterium jannaschii]|uniref:hypothetical protein n=1 Tax=Marinobacterium jannaschii TaxID=64970 RepID=UPI000489100A|nr:hypothetical protein [Marinobacterium jannaschii]